MFGIFLVTSPVMFADLPPVLLPPLPQFSVNAIVWDWLQHIFQTLSNLSSNSL